MIVRMIFGGGLIAFLACVYSGVLWFLQENDHAINSGAWWFGNSLIGLIGVFTVALRERSLSKHGRRTQFCRNAVRQIDNDLGNFRNIMADRIGGYNSLAHQEAVEKNSFECVKKQIKPLSKYWRYKWLVRSCIREIDANYGRRREDMDLGLLVDLVSKLESRLRKELDDL